MKQKFQRSLSHTLAQWLHGLRTAPLLALSMWCGMWANLNATDWYLDTPRSASDWLLMARCWMPLAILIVAIAMLIARGGVRLPALSANLMLFLYSMVATVACVFSRVPKSASCWAIVQLCVIFVAWCFTSGKRPREDARIMLAATWIITLVIAIVLAKTVGSSLTEGASSYGSSTHDLEGLSRSSGVARWAAVAGLVCLLRAFQSRNILRFFVFLGLACGSIFIVYRMQSRGAIFGMAAALVFSAFLSKRVRTFAAIFLLVPALFMVILVPPQKISDKVRDYLMRGQSESQFESMTGRTESWKEGMEEFRQWPVLGRSYRADRAAIGNHVHNSFVQALMFGGIVGFLPYVLSWVFGWILFARVFKRRKWLSPVDDQYFMEASTIIMFFTVRAIPETTTASFSVDLLIVAACFAYIECIALTLSHREDALRRAHLALRKARFSRWNLSSAAQV